MHAYLRSRHVRVSISLSTHLSVCECARSLSPLVPDVNGSSEKRPPADEGDPLDVYLRRRRESERVAWVARVVSHGNGVLQRCQNRRLIKRNSIGVPSRWSFAIDLPKYIENSCVVYVKTSILNTSMPGATRRSGPRYPRMASSSSGVKRGAPVPCGAEDPRSPSSSPPPRPPPLLLPALMAAWVAGSRWGAMPVSACTPSNQPYLNDARANDSQKEEGEEEEDEVEGGGGGGGGEGGGGKE